MMLYEVSEDFLKLSPVDSTHFSELGIWERKHIQSWVKKNPSILGEELLIISEEFDRFKQSPERLDLLAVDKQGKLTVIELKRDASGTKADLQAIRYAAMVSPMTIEKVQPYYEAFLGVENDEDNADLAEDIRSFIDSEVDFNDFDDYPRIILAAENFSPEITATVLWLRSFEVDISCVRIEPHKLAKGQVVLRSDVIIPLPEAKSYQVEIEEKQKVIKHRTKRTWNLMPFAEVFSSYCSESFPELNLRVVREQRSNANYYPGEWECPAFFTGEGWPKTADGSHVLLSIELFSNRQSLYISIILGPGPSMYREAIWSVVTKNFDLFYRKRNPESRKLNDKYAFLYSRNLISNQLDQNTTPEGALEQTKPILDNFFSNELPKINDVLVPVLKRLDPVHIDNPENSIE